MIKNFEDIKLLLGNGKTERRIAVVAANDEHTIEAVALSVRGGLARPVLLGETAEIKTLLEKYECPLGMVEIIPAAGTEEAALLAAGMVKEGTVNCIMKGGIETGSFMRVLVNRETGIRKRDTMSLLAFMESPYYHKVFAITDVGLLTYPSLDQKQQAIKNAVEAFSLLGIKTPKVAVLAAVEKVNPKMPGSVDAGELKERAGTGEIPGCILEGPISYDLAMEKGAAEIKNYESPVAGDADILVVSNITAGNILAKALTTTGGAKTCGVVLGAMVPLILTSRSATVDDKYMSIALSVLIGSAQQAGNHEKA
ncbi:MAG: phosphate butyryltransferase [Treponema sp.]|nr:phosphate butyryltransferase [Treponema sp.]